MAVNQLGLLRSRMEADHLGSFFLFDVPVLFPPKIGKAVLVLASLTVSRAGLELWGA